MSDDMQIGLYMGFWLGAFVTLLTIGLIVATRG